MTPEDLKRCIASGIQEFMSSPEYAAQQKKIIDQSWQEKFGKVLDSLNQRVNTVMAENKQLQQQWSSVVKQNREMSDRISKLEEKLVQNERKDLRFNLRLSGLPEEEKEETPRKVSDFLKDNLKIHVPLEQIVSANRLGIKKIDAKLHRQILVKFNNEWTPRALMKARFALKDIQGDQKVFMNWDLTKETSKLFYLARKMKAEKQISDVYIKNHTVFVRKHPRGEEVKVDNLNTLAYLEDSTTSSASTSTDNSITSSMADSNTVLSQRMNLRESSSSYIS